MRQRVMRYTKWSIMGKGMPVRRTGMVGLLLAVGMLAALAACQPLPPVDDGAGADAAVSDAATSDAAASDGVESSAVGQDVAVSAETIADGEAVADDAVSDEAEADEAVADEAETDEAETDEAVADEAVADDAEAAEAVADEAVVDGAVAGEGEAAEAVEEEAVADEALIAAGMAVYRAQYCGICHVFEAAGTTGRFGPPHDGVATAALERLQDPRYAGIAQTAEEYLYESLVKPEIYIVEGFVGTSHRMPPYTHLPEEDLRTLVALLLSAR